MSHDEALARLRNSVHGVFSTVHPVRGVDTIPVVDFDVTDLVEGPLDDGNSDFNWKAADPMNGAAGATSAFPGGGASKGPTVRVARGNNVTEVPVGGKN